MTRAAKKPTPKPEKPAKAAAGKPAKTAAGKPAKAAAKSDKAVAAKPEKAVAAKPENAAVAKPGLQAHPDAKLTKKQVERLYERLVQERERVTAGMGNHLSEAIGDSDPLADEMDMAQRHSEQAYLMRFADKERKLLSEIAHAISKLESGEYGLCEGTGEPISLRRLELRPWTRYSVEYKEQVEREKRQHRIG